MDMGKWRRTEACRSLNGMSDGVDENVGTTLLARMKSLVADFLVLATAVFLLGGIVFLVVSLFRIGNVGRSVVSAVSDCSAALVAAAWPMLIVVLVVLYRHHVVEVLNALPCFVRNSSIAHLMGKVSVAPQDVGGGHGVEADAKCQDSIAEKGNGGTVKRTSKDDSRDGGGGKNAKCTRSGAGDTFVEGILATIQDESGEFVYRGVNLFSRRDYRFDGAIVGDDLITGIEVSRGDVEDDRRRLDRIGRFYQSISRRDRKCFALVYCIPIGQNARAAELREHCRRQGFDFRVTFRRCADVKSQQS